MSTDKYYNMLLNLLLFLSAYIYIYALCRVVVLLLLLNCIYNLCCCCLLVRFVQSAHDFSNRALQLAKRVWVAMQVEVVVLEKEAI